MAYGFGTTGKMDETPDQRTIRDLRAENERLVTTRNQLIRERDSHQRGETVAQQQAELARKRQLETISNLRKDLGQADVRARKTYEARLEEQRKQLGALNTRYERNLRENREHVVNERIVDLTARLRNKNKLLTQALNELDAALLEGMKSRKEAADAKARNNADCLQELHKQMRQNTAHQHVIAGLKARVVDLERQLVDVASGNTGQFELGQMVEYRESSSERWRRGAITGTTPRNDSATVRDELTGDLVHLGYRLRVVPPVKFDIRVMRPDGTVGFAGQATEAQINEAINLLGGSISGK